MSRDGREFPRDVRVFSRAGDVTRALIGARIWFLFPTRYIGVEAKGAVLVALAVTTCTRLVPRPSSPRARAASTDLTALVSGVVDGTHNRGRDKQTQLPYLLNRHLSDDPGELQ